MKEESDPEEVPEDELAHAHERVVFGPPLDAESALRGWAGAEEVETVLDLRRRFEEAEADEGIGTVAGAGDFRLVDEIGRGAMAVVWEAEQRSLGRRVAIKLLAPHHRNPESVGRFEREARAGGRLQHPGIVRTYAIGTIAGLHYIVQELVPGGRTLEDRIAELAGCERLPGDYVDRVARWFVTLAEALEFAHASGVVHRDVKPSNILLTEEDEPRLADFGLARMEDDLALSTTGAVLGTVYYMSPEQAVGHGQGVDHRTDVYSLGATLYEALTSVRPFRGRTSHEVLDKILHEPPPDPRTIRPELPRELAAICLKALEKRPQDRYASMAAFAADLRRFAAGRPILARTPSTSRRLLGWARRNSSQSAAIGLGLLSGGLVLFLFLEGGGRDAREGGGPGDDPALAAFAPSWRGPFDFDAALAAQRVLEDGTGWRFPQTGSERFVLKTRSDSDRVALELAARLDAWFARFDEDWGRQTRTGVAVVRLCEAPDEWATRVPPAARDDLCALDPGTGELLLDFTGVVPRARVYAALPPVLVELYFHLSRGPLRPHPWFTEGAAAYYAGLELERSGDGWVARAGPLGDRLDGLDRDLAAGRAVPLERLLHASREAWAEGGPGLREEAWSLFVLFRGHPAVAEAAAELVDEYGDVPRRYLDALQAATRLRLREAASDGGPAAPAPGERRPAPELSPEAWEEIRELALAEAWGGVDLAAFELDWRRCIRTR